MPPLSMMTPEKTGEIPLVLPQHKSGPSPTLPSASLPLLTVSSQIFTNPEDVTEHIDNMSRRPSKAAKRRERKLSKQADHPPVVTGKKQVRPRRCARHANAGSLPDPNADGQLRELKLRMNKKRTHKRKQNEQNKGSTKRVKKKRAVKKKRVVKKQLFLKNQTGDTLEDLELDKQTIEFTKSRIRKMKQYDLEEGVLPLKDGRVAKTFDKEVFLGTITGVDFDENGLELYHIMYDDGDEEDLHYRECRNAVCLFKKIDEDDKRWS